MQHEHGFLWRAMIDTVDGARDGATTGDLAAWLDSYREDKHLLGFTWS